MHAIQCCVPDATLLPAGIDRLYPAEPARRHRAGRSARRGSVTATATPTSTTSTSATPTARSSSAGRACGCGPCASRTAPARGCPRCSAPTWSVSSRTGSGSRRSAWWSRTRPAARRGRSALRRQTDGGGQPDAGPARRGPVPRRRQAGGGRRGQHLGLAQRGRDARGGRSEGRWAATRKWSSERSADEWQALLGTEHFALAGLVARERGEDLAVAATRVWGAIECLRKVGPRAGRADHADRVAVRTAGCCSGPAAAQHRDVPHRGCVTRRSRSSSPS